MMLKYLIQNSIFRYSKNYSSLTNETGIKDAVNMGDLICLLATVRTLNVKLFHVVDVICIFNVPISVDTSYVKPDKLLLNNKRNEVCKPNYNLCFKVKRISLSTMSTVC